MCESYETGTPWEHLAEPSALVARSRGTARVLAALMGQSAETPKTTNRSAALGDEVDRPDESSVFGPQLALDLDPDGIRDEDSLWNAVDDGGEVGVETAGSIEANEMEAPVERQDRPGDFATETPVLTDPVARPSVELQDQWMAEVIDSSRQTEGTTRATDVAATEGAPDPAPEACRSIASAQTEWRPPNTPSSEPSSQDADPEGRPPVERQPAAGVGDAVGEGSPPQAQAAPTHREETEPQTPVKELTKSPRRDPKEDPPVVVRRVAGCAPSLEGARPGKVGRRQQRSKEEELRKRRQELLRKAIARRLEGYEKPGDPVPVRRPRREIQPTRKLTWKPGDPFAGWSANYAEHFRWHVMFLTAGGVAGGGYLALRLLMLTGVI